MGCTYITENLLHFSLIKTEYLGALDTPIKHKFQIPGAFF